MEDMHVVVVARLLNRLNLVFQMLGQFIICSLRYHLSTLEQQYMSETLQTNRIQNARSLAKLQAHGHCSSFPEPSLSTSLLPPLTSNSDNVTLSHPPLEAASSTAGSEGAGSEGSTPTGNVKKKHRLRLGAGSGNRFKSLHTSNGNTYILAGSPLLSLILYTKRGEPMV